MKCQKNRACVKQPGNAPPDNRKKCTGCDNVFYKDKTEKSFSSCKKTYNETIVKKIVAEDIVNVFIKLQKVYDEFRNYNNLKETKINGFEACTALLDKCGRIARQVKHFERNDPKEDWPDGLLEAITGFMVYILLILKSYNINIQYQYSGIVKELNSSIKQYIKDIK